MGAAAGGMGLVVIVFLFVLGVLWVLLPFAVFGIKDLAKTLIAEQRKTNDLLARIAGTPIAKPKEIAPYEPTNLYGAGAVPADTGGASKT